jgi:hypothetical protein
VATFDLPPNYGTDRDSAILKHAQAGDLEVDWVALNMSANGHDVEILVTPDAVKLAGVRINVSATLQQQLADLFGAFLFTCKVADAHYLARGTTITPYPMPITSTTAAMQLESQKMDAGVAAAGGLESGMTLGTVGKHWVIDNALGQHSGMAENYGWYLPLGTKSPWQGVAIYPSVTSKALVIQQPSWAHDASHSDYSQQCCLMHRSCRVDGQDRDLSDVLADATLGPLLSHNGPIPKSLQRQPGVPLYACAMPKKAARVQAFVTQQDIGMCPTPPRPSNIETETTPNWKLVMASTAACGLTVGAFWLAMRLAKRAA